jgi:hypothetical protein
VDTVGGPRFASGPNNVRSGRDTFDVIREELGHLTTWGERHRRLIARLTIVALLTLVVDAVGTTLIYLAERNAPHSEITSFGDALFFTTVQLLTVSSQIRNPFTTWGRLVDVGLEIWGVLVVAGSTGAAAAFFLQADE